MEGGMKQKYTTDKKMSTTVAQLLESSISSLPIILILFSLPFLLSKWLFTKGTKRSPPPSPLKLPILGHLHLLGSYPHRSLRSLARRYGPIMGLRLGNAQAVVVTSAEASREIMKTHDLVFANRPESRTARKLLYDLKDITVAPYGEYWRQLKSICVLQLLGNSRVQSFRSVREEETSLLMNEIRDHYSYSCSNVLNLSEMFGSIASDVVCRAAIGRKYGGGGEQEREEQGKKLRQLLRDLVALLVVNIEDFLPWLGWINWLNGRNAKVDRVAREVDEFLEGVVEERMDQMKRGSINIDGEKRRGDFLDILLGIQKDLHNQAAAGVSVGSRDTIKALILDVFAGGTDTTSTVLEWAMTELLRHPRIMKELQEEVRGVAKEKPDITEDDLEKMHYLKAVIKETLRCHTPLPLLVPRRATKDVKVMDYDIAAGTIVIINAWAIGRDPELWDNPEDFKPERFLNSSLDFKGRDFQFIPFGGGRRGCPGINFAMAINELVLANMVHKFDWELPEGVKGEDLDMTESTGSTIHRTVPLLAVPTPYSMKIIESILQNRSNDRTFVPTDKERERGAVGPI